MATLLIADHDNTTLNIATAKALTAATALGEPVHILVAGNGCKTVAEQAAKLSGAAQVRIAEHPAYQHFLAEPLADLIITLSGEYNAIVSAATSNGKNTAPRVAALLDVMQVSEVIRVISPTTFERPIYAGNAIQTVQTTDSKRVLTIRTAAFAATSSDGSAPISAIDHAAAAAGSQFISEEVTVSDRPSLGAAKIIVSGGRALGSTEQFNKFITPLADTLHAAIGASRAAVDSGFAPNDCQVGQTGTVVAPELYIAVGISGAVQHLAGMKDSKIIVAINNDEEAPIFQVADYGLVADLFEAVPALIDNLKQLQN